MDAGEIRRIIAEDMLLHAGGKALAIGGFPATGKTTLAHAMKGVVVLGAERFLMSLRNREKLGITGCSERSHDMEHYSNCIDSLVRGLAVSLKDYSWETHRLTDESRTLQLVDGQRLLTEGPVVSLNAIARHCDYIWFLKPERMTEWFRFAVKRDTTVRGYSQEDAERINKLKQREILDIYKKSRGNIDKVVKVRYRGDDIFYEV